MRIRPASPVLVSAGVVVGGLAFGLAVAFSQGPAPGGPPQGQPGAPPPPKNLQYFPKDTPRPELLKSMRQFSMALGVGCEHCHVDEDGPNGRQDFASDEKAPKLKARAMLLMTKQINDELLAKIPNRTNPPVMVGCVTCHHGLAVPETLAGHLAAAITAGGVDSAVAELRHLRDQSETGHFDVSERGVIDAARTLAAGGKNAEALALLNANAGYHANPSMTQTAMAEIYVAQGDTARAVETLRAVLTKDPDNRRVKMMLDHLTGVRRAP